ncbi:MAG TPA: hypothetical protein DCL35_07900 [Candidatus Omnitrophica bacterium]|nr:hypothetical protein [Candidatus Omnitrophota bacterium]
MDKDFMLDPWFITGFSDGEAAFTFSRSGKGFSLYFSITQREDNKDIIDKIYTYFGGVGKIYSRKERLPSKYSGHTKPNTYFRVCKQKELLRVIEHFDKFPLQSKKREVYNIWREMAIAKTKYFLNCASDEFAVFSKQLSVLNQKSRAFKKHSKSAH